MVEIEHTPQYQLPWPVLTSRLHRSVNIFITTSTSVYNLYIAHLGATLGYIFTNLTLALHTIGTNLLKLTNTNNSIGA